MLDENISWEEHIRTVETNIGFTLEAHTHSTYACAVTKFLNPYVYVSSSHLSIYA